MEEAGLHFFLPPPRVHAQRHAKRTPIHLDINSKVDLIIRVACDYSAIQIQELHSCRKDEIENGRA